MDCAKSCPRDQDGKPTNIWCGDRCMTEYSCIRECQQTGTDTSRASVSSPKPRSGAYLYRPGDGYGTRYDSLAECGRAQEKAGVGVCMMK
jgi:hypothetical protein